MPSPSGNFVIEPSQTPSNTTSSFAALWSLLTQNEIPAGQLHFTLVHGAKAKKYTSESNVISMRVNAERCRRVCRFSDRKSKVFLYPLPFQARQNALVHFTDGVAQNLDILRGVGCDHLFCASDLNHKLPIAKKTYRDIAASPYPIL